MRRDVRKGWTAALVLVGLTGLAGCGSGSGVPSFDEDGLVSLLPGSETSGVTAVSRITPTSGPASGGTRITITGVGFTLKPRQFNFYQGGRLPLTDIEVISDTEIRATTPAVTIPDGESSYADNLICCDQNDLCFDTDKYFTFKR